MSDHDRILSSITAQRTLEDGCLSCAYSRVYCRAVLYLDSEPCCSGCSHG